MLSVSSLKKLTFVPVFVLLASVFLLKKDPAQAQLSKIELACKHVSPIEQSYLARHINFAQYSKNLESRTVDQFIEKLDGFKIYLLQSDVDQIRKEMANIFAHTKARDCEPIKTAQKLLQTRVAERVAFVKKTLDKSFKLNDKLEVQLDPKVRKFATSTQAANNFLSQYLHFQVANYVSTDMSLEEARSNVIRSYERIEKRIKEYKDTDLLASYIDAFSHSLDPHSSYLTADALEDFEIQMRLSLEGIGATLSSRDGFTVIEQLIPGGSAARSGKLKPKDKIIAVAQGNDGKFENVIEMDLRDVVAKIRGAKGSQVRLSVLRKTGKETTKFEVALQRDQIKLEDEAASMTYIDREFEEAGQKVIRKVGLLNLPAFYADSRKSGRSASKDMRALLKQANEKKVDAVVLDLSTNGGGSLDDAVKIAGLFFKTGNVVKQSHRDPSREEIELADDDPTVDYAGPLVVLQSRISASASEIVAGTLKDYDRAVIVGGDHTFGKGSVQSVEPLPPGLGALKTTVGMFFIPGGNSTQHRGVAADIIFPSIYNDDEIGEKSLDYSLPPKKIKPFISKSAYVTAGPTQWRTVDQALIQNLRKKSLVRVAANKDFKKILEDIKKNKVKGKMVKVSDILSKDDKDKKDAAKSVSETADVDEDNANAMLTPEEKKKKYLERADIQEAINVAFDEAYLMTPKITVTGQKPVARESKAN